MIKVSSGSVTSMTNAEYHAAEGVSRSDLMLFYKSPFHYYSAKYNFNRAKKTSPSMILGTLVHKMVLEPNSFADEFVIMPKFTTKKADKHLKTEWLEENKNKTIISLNLYDHAVEISDAFKRDHRFKVLQLDRCNKEQSIFFTHDRTGLTFKCRPDAFILGIPGTLNAHKSLNNGVAFDVKTCADASPGAFTRSILSNGYHIQAAIVKLGLQSVGIEMQTFWNCAIENTYPYVTAMYQYDEEIILKGLDDFEALASQFAVCHERKVWPAYNTQTLYLPRWAAQEIINEVDFDDEEEKEDE